MNLPNVRDGLVRKDYSTETIDNQASTLLSSSLITQLEDTYIELCALATSHAKILTPKFIPSHSLRYEPAHCDDVSDCDISGDLDAKSQLKDGYRFTAKRMSYAEVLSALSEKNSGELQAPEHLKLEMANHLIKLDDGRFEGFEWKARLLSKEGSHSEAKRSIEMAMDLAPKKHYLKMLAGNICQQLLMFDEAEGYYLELRKVRPNNTQVMVKLARLYTYLKRYSEAEDLYIALLDSNPSVQIKLYYIRLLELVKGVSGAIEYAEASLAQEYNKLIDLEIARLKLRKRLAGSKELYEKKHLAKYQLAQLQGVCKSLSEKGVRAEAVYNLFYWASLHTTHEY